MDWLLVGCGALMAWATLCVISGERLRRKQVQEIDDRAAAAAGNVASRSAEKGSPSRPAAAVTKRAA